MISNYFENNYLPRIIEREEMYRLTCHAIASDDTISFLFPKPVTITYYLTGILYF